MDQSSGNALGLILILCHCVRLSELVHFGYTDESEYGHLDWPPDSLRKLVQRQNTYKALKKFAREVLEKKRVEALVVSDLYRVSLILPKPRTFPNHPVTLENDWSKQSQTCGSGRRQSPIHIDSELALPLALPALEMVGFHNLIPAPVLITNTGHSVEIKSLVKGYAQVFGAFLPGTFDVETIHFHWGSKNNKGSEHVLNQVRYPMEMHIVCKNRIYKNVTEALTHPDGLAVLAVFYHLQEKASRPLKKILTDLQMVRSEGSVTYLSRSFPLYLLVPRERDIFYSYHGSLTTPPCSEAVTWFIFPQSLPVSYSQMSQFRQLSSGSDVLVDNFRHIQKLGMRQIYVRRQPTEYSPLLAAQWNQTVQKLWRDEY